jgi:1-phosphofructokinase
MIVTLTLNPSLDRTIEVDRLTRGAVLRAGRARLDPGGKGVNVSRALLANGRPSRAVLPCGGDDGERLVQLLQQEGVAVVAVPTGGHTRSNVTLAEPDGTVTKVNEPGGPMTGVELDRVARAVVAATGDQAADWVVACGSLPPGVPLDVYAQLVRRLAEEGVRVAVDTSGPALLAAVSAGVALVKPNREELAEAVGRPLDSLRDVVDAAQEIRSWGAGTVLASLGADGAVLVGPDGVLAGESPQVEARSAVGAGDCFLAGFLAAGGRGADALAEALAWGAAAASQPGSRMPGPADISRRGVRVQPGPDLERPLLSSN